MPPEIGSKVRFRADFTRDRLFTFVRSLMVDQDLAKSFRENPSEHLTQLGIELDGPSHDLLTIEGLQKVVGGSEDHPCETLVFVGVGIMIQTSER